MTGNRNRTWYEVRKSFSIPKGNAKIQFAIGETVEIYVHDKTDRKIVFIPVRNINKNITVFVAKNEFDSLVFNNLICWKEEQQPQDKPRTKVPTP